MISRMNIPEGRLRKTAVINSRGLFSQVNDGCVIYLHISNGLKTEKAEHWVLRIHKHDI
jgi:hypothetical protein